VRWENNEAFVKVLNLGCGTKTSPKAINIDWSIYLTIKSNYVFRLCSPIILSEDRRNKLCALDRSILVHDIRKGLPFDGHSIDAVYHSHMFEHIDRNKAPIFLQEVKRVLVPGGIHRIVVPDMEGLANAYLRHVAQVKDDPSSACDHDRYISDMIEQMVRREAYGTRHQPFVLRTVENILLGDARARGETHQWMYDKVNLAYLLQGNGFNDIQVRSYNNSAIPDWQSFGLEVTEDGSEYKPQSLYMEATT